MADNNFSLNSLSIDPQFDFLEQFITLDHSSAVNNFLEANDNIYENSVIPSRYVDENEFIVLCNAKMANNKKSFSFYSLNIQSLPAKYVEFVEHINILNYNNCSPNVICLQELWRIIDPALYSVPGYSELHVKSRFSKQGGGVGLYFKNGIKFKIINEKSIFMDQVLETIFAEITLPSNKKAVVGSIYRPSSNHPTLTPNEQFEQSIELLSNLLSDLTSVYDEIYIFGDLNIDVLKYSSCKFATEYVDLLFSFGLLQTVTKPTRCTINSATLIDHAIVLPKPQPFESVILVSKVSDHFPVILFGNSVAPKKPLKEVTSRDFSEANINKFKCATSSFNWNFVTDINDTQEAFSSFSNVFHNLYNLHFPLVTTKFNKNHHQIEKWMSKGILISRSTKLKLAKNCLISPSLENNLKYKSYRNVYNTTIRGAKKLDFEKELKRGQSDLKKTWAILKKAINKQNYKSSTMDCLKIDNAC